MYTKVAFAGLLAAGLSKTASALTLDLEDPASIRNAAASIAQGLFSYYDHSTVGVNGTADWQVGLFPFLPYYWWESGGIWGGMTNYIRYSSDSTYLNWTVDAIAAQVGPNNDFIPPQQSGNEANDDQAFWAFAALSAYENGFQGHSSSDAANPYLTSAINVFNDMTARWALDSSTCGGGLRWQYNPKLNGYTYKNAISNGGFFNIAARLALATGNSTYANWAARIYSWSTTAGLLDATGHVYDGAGVQQNCTQLSQQQWSYNSAVYMAGAAAMYNYTSRVPPSYNNNTSQHQQLALWQNRTSTLVAAASATFFDPFGNATGVMFEHCEPAGTCNTDQKSFKAYLARFMTQTAVLVPAARPQIKDLLARSAAAAAAACVQPGNGNGNGSATCGAKWYTGAWDGTRDLGQQLTALEVVQSLLMLW